MSQPSDRDRWLRVRAIVELALETPASDRDRVIADACAGDPGLAAEVRRLVAAHQRGDALESPLDAVTALVDDGRHQAGDRVGKYTIEQELARGGMGVVYRAWDNIIERRVALKALSPLLPANMEARERLRREARAAGRFSHESVATIYDLEEIETELFIVSEYVDGETLRARMAGGPLPVRDVVSIALAVARGLAAAHEHGVVHRDLKPENVMLDATGRVKVVDFGIASIGPAGHGLTRTGILIGTVGYMAPEQVSGQGADARSDVFALGIVMYEMLSGRHPWGDTAWRDLAAVVARDAIPIESVRRDVPHELAHVVSIAMAKAPAARYPTAGALVPALESVNDALRPTPASGALGIAPLPPPLSRAVWWLQFHQLAATISLALMMVPAWKLMSRLPKPSGRILVMTLLAMAAALGTARLHLWFTARHHQSELAKEIGRLAPLVRWGNHAFAFGLLIGAFAVADPSTELAAVLIGLAVGTVVVGELIEPATLERARRESSPRS